MRTISVSLERVERFDPLVVYRLQPLGCLVVLKTTPSNRPTEFFPLSVAEARALAAGVAEGAWTLQDLPTFHDTGARLLHLRPAPVTFDTVVQYVEAMRAPPA